MRIWGIHIGCYNDSGRFKDKAFKEWVLADRYLVGRGFRFDHDQDMYLTDDYFGDNTFDKRWAKIKPIEYFDE